ncbi:alpha/beta hydrolase [Hymenobacter sp. 15J16-1T3B]|uniref:alpha/beta fold hydrolase n=1 Tax=Hymenobacter sp. 15J16-1T3B TaxID=2886941 RepID=UPI001D1057F7|nr:alpha/beta hydrolase [Hymenobacter sp. 15J16-1T3B]MCC3158406.1 alpha/beta hydrolase [Hymenobacter sp. 15J16-1T3B]
MFRFLAHRPRRAALLLALLFPLTLLAAPRPAKLTNGPVALKTTDGVQLFASVTGQGVPCVFVHGGPGAWSGMPEQLAGPLLNDRLQMIWLDQRGCGRSQNAPRHDYSLARLVQDLEDVRQQLGLESWVLMAHSFGGTIATEYAARHPERVRGLVLVECTLNLPASMQDMIQSGFDFVQVPDRTPYLDQGKPVQERFGLMVQHFNEHNVWRQLQYTTDAGFDSVSKADESNPHTGNEFGQYAMGISDYQRDFTALTPDIKAPVLVMTGKRDLCIGANHYKLFRFPRQQVALMQTGHVPFVEEPEAFRQAVLTWLKKLPRRAA